MLRIAFTFIVLVPILTAQAAYSQSTSAAHPSVLDVTTMDPSVDPCTDFFHILVRRLAEKESDPA